jgi:hypothetical protein
MNETQVIPKAPEHPCLKLVRFRRPKIISSPSYADYRPKTNAIILLDMGHTLRGERTGEEQGKGRRPKT